MSIVDLLFPRACLGCKKEGGYICLTCLNKMPKVRQICPVCERPSVDGMSHVKCKKPWGLDGLISVWAYREVVRKAIIALKYKFAKEVSKELARHIYTAFNKEKPVFPRGPFLVPIPLHWYRGNWRGFNQADLVGKLISEKLGWKYAQDLLTRKKLTRPQTELKGEERKQNIRGAFSLNPDYQSLIIDHRPLVLFDDVWTTGSTLKEAAKVLKRSGAREVWGLTIAR